MVVAHSLSLAFIGTQVGFSIYRQSVRSRPVKIKFKCLMRVGLEGGFSNQILLYRETLMKKTILRLMWLNPASAKYTRSVYT